MNITERAELFATAAHGATGQTRKYTDEPYVVHLREVAQLVAEHGGDDAMIAAAWLHDVVEDTAITLDQITAHFGDDVASLVFALTDVSRPEDGNRATRKELDRRHVAKAPARAMTIKLADIISNISSIAQFDPVFAEVYLPERTRVLEVLGAGDPALFQKAEQALNAARAHLATRKPAP